MSIACSSGTDHSFIFCRVCCCNTSRVPYSFDNCHPSLNFCSLVGSFIKVYLFNRVTPPYWSGNVVKVVHVLEVKQYITLHTFILFTFLSLTFCMERIFLTLLYCRFTFYEGQ